MSATMRPSYDEALSRGLIGDVRLGVDFQRNPWDTNCFMAVFYLEFIDRTGRTNEPDWLYFAAFVAHPAHSAAYNQAVGHGQSSASAKEHQDLYAALHFIGNPEVNCVHIDADLLRVAAEFHPEVGRVLLPAPEAQDRSLLPGGVIQLRDMIVQEINEGHDYWRAIWRPRVGDVPVSGPVWFF